jgi:hypothetical protein
MGNGVQERIAKNNLIFREANEKIRARADDAPLASVPFLCECPDPECTTIVRLTLPEYQAVRADPAHFFTATGHEHAETPVGRVVSRKDAYVIVEKDIREG